MLIEPLVCCWYYIVKFYFCVIFQAEQVLLKLRGTNRVDKELSGIRVSIASEKVWADQF